MDLRKARWRKAARSTNNGGHCVEIASTNGIIAVRDSKNPHGPVLTFTRREWHEFTATIK